MKEFKINFVGNDEEIKKEDILNDFDFNYLPINNLPVSYFPLNNGLLSNELKKINNEDLTSGEALEGIELTINALNSPYTILVKKNINCKLNLSGTLKDIRLNKGIYTIKFDNNGYNIIEKNKKDIIYKELKSGSTSINLNFIDASNSSNVKKISSNIKGIDINASIGVSVETASDNPNYNLLVYRDKRISSTLKLNKDISCDILLVGGGGCGGTSYGGSGGGGGAVIYLQNQKLINGTYLIHVGWGGTYGNKGVDSTIALNSYSGVIYKALGGGGGGENTKYILINGGSGGGGRNIAGIALLDNKPEGKFGNNGGRGTSGKLEKNWGGGGGGGASLAGNNAKLNGDLSKAGNGGNGIEISITGTPTYYGGGGGGGVSIHGESAGSGGLGGGGAGSKGPNTAISGTANTGGGGGGSGFNGVSFGQSGEGGSGIVIIRVKNEDIVKDVNNDEILTSLLTSYDTRIINEINNLLEKKMIEFNNDEKPYNYLGIYPLVILIIIFWIFIFLFLLKFVHHYFVSIYLYILIFIIIFLLIFGSLWFLYTNNDLL